MVGSYCEEKEHVGFIPNGLFTGPKFYQFSFVQNGKPESPEHNNESSARKLYIPFADVHARLADIQSLTRVSEAAPASTASVKQSISQWIACGDERLNIDQSKASMMNFR